MKQAAVVVCAQIRIPQMPDKEMAVLLVLFGFLTNAVHQLVPRLGPVVVSAFEKVFDGSGGKAFKEAPGYAARNPVFHPTQGDVGQ
jgi:hypothetical protein